MGCFADTFDVTDSIGDMSQGLLLKEGGNRSN